MFDLYIQNNFGLLKKKYRLKMRNLYFQPSPSG